MPAWPAESGFHGLKRPVLLRHEGMRPMHRDDSYLDIVTCIIFPDALLIDNDGACPGFRWNKVCWIRQCIQSASIGCFRSHNIAGKMHDVVAIRDISFTGL